MIPPGDECDLWFIRQGKLKPCIDKTGYRMCNLCPVPAHHGFEDVPGKNGQTKTIRRFIPRAEGEPAILAWEEEIMRIRERIDAIESLMAKSPR